MISATVRERLRERFLAKAKAVFERSLEQGIAQGMDLAQIEVVVGELKGELSSVWLECIVEAHVQDQTGPGSCCERCGREMR
jgi:hypothetical protein